MTGKRIGLIIGNNYPDSKSKLRFAVADALKIKEILENKDICGFDEVTCLIDKMSREALMEVERTLKIEADLTFIYFSGHGNKDFENELCLLFNDTEKDALLSTSLTFDFIKKCRRYPARKSVIIVLDCCYSGIAGVRDNDLTEVFKKRSGSGTVILTSTGLTGDSSAKEDERLGHGVFTYYLIEGLEKGYADKRGEGYIYINDLYDYAYEKTKNSCPQSPQMIGYIEGQSILIGINPQKVRELEYKSMSKRLVQKCIEYNLPGSVLDLSLTALKNNYKAVSTLESVDRRVHNLITSFLEGDLSPENYSESIQYLKEIGVNFECPQKEEKTTISEAESLNSGNIKPREEPNPLEIPKNFTNSIGMSFVLIPAGEFMMGSRSEESGGWSDESPVHRVIIKTPFYLGKYPVTQSQWKKIMGYNPSNFRDEDRPVETVSWEEVQEFIKKINDFECTDKYRLPSEAEWEYACRAGTQTKYSFGDDESKIDEYAWYNENSHRETHPVGQKKPNPWDLYDMHGNIWEWVQDREHPNYNGAPSDGSAWENGDSSDWIFRGGSWVYNSRICRSANRNWNYPDYRLYDLGFRLLREL